MARGKDKWNGEDRRAPATVLVVGDDDDSNELISRLLVARGYHSLTSPSPDDGLTKIVTHLPRCVVLDLAAGGIGSNLKMLETLRTHSDRRVSMVRVVLVARSHANRVFSYQSGVDTFIVRPFHADDLLALVAEAIERRPEERVEHRRHELENS